MSVFIDTNILVYANTADPQLAEPCLKILEAIADGLVEGRTSVAVIEEPEAAPRGGPARAHQAAPGCVGTRHE